VCSQPLDLGAGGGKLIAKTGNLRTGNVQLGAGGVTLGDRFANPLVDFST